QVDSERVELRVEESHDVRAWLQSFDAIRARGIGRRARQAIRRIALHLHDRARQRPARETVDHHSGDDRLRRHGVAREKRQTCERSKTAMSQSHPNKRECMNPQTTMHPSTATRIGKAYHESLAGVRWLKFMP